MRIKHEISWVLIVGKEIKVKVLKLLALIVAACSFDG